MGVMSVFLDHAATTQLRPEALAALTAALTTLGNPSSVHSAGQASRQILEDARDTLALAVDCHRSEVVFNSGGTEADNQAVKGIFWARRRAEPGRNVIISAATEHHALIDPIEWLERHDGAEIHWLPVAQNGTVDLAALREYLSQNHERVALITLMWANNETGVITDIPAVCRMAAEYQIPVHSDAVAALGHLPLSFRDSGLSAMSLSGHKVGAPIGVGALIVSRSLKLDSLIHGGGQERSLRSGTMNYPLAASFAEAARVAVATLPAREQQTRALRDHLESEVRKLVPEVIVTAVTAERLPDNAHFIFPGILGDSLLFLLDSAGVQVSTGSACQAGVVGPSHVLLGMGYSEDLAQACIRVTLGYSTTKADIDTLLAELPAAHAAALRAGQVR
jgi:cysteine desulfurase